MPNWKLLFLDVDGTLLTSDYRISPLTRRVLGMLSDASVDIILSSGRPLRNILPYHRALGLTTPIIAYNGALIEDPIAHKPLFRAGLDHALLYPDILPILASANTYLFESGDNAIYANRSDQRLEDYFPLNNPYARRVSFEEALRKDPYIFVFSLPFDEGSLNQKIVSKSPLFEYRRWNRYPFGELYRKDVDKGKAAAYLAHLLNVSPDDIYAFGDRDNDAPMLRYAKHGYAMRNSVSVALKNAFPVTEKGNDQDGLALELIRLFGLKL